MHARVYSYIHVQDAMLACTRVFLHTCARCKKKESGEKKKESGEKKKESGEKTEDDWR